jgi:hypothetical protein
VTASAESILDVFAKGDTPPKKVTVNELTAVA